MATRVIRKEADRKEMEKEMLLKVLMSLLRDEENRYCADCESKGPRWASWNIGIFVCIRCAGIHRKLGVHISKVKSINLDGWQAEQVQSMCVMGNSVAKAVYEDSLPSHFRRPQSDQSLESFIRAKYEHKRYIMKDWVPPKVNLADIVIYDDIMELRTTGIVRPAGARKTKAVPAATAPAAAAAAPVAPKAPQNELLDLDLGGRQAPTRVAQSSVGDLFDLVTPAAVATTTSNGAAVDDLFSDFVSASAAPNQQASAAAPSHDGLAGIDMSSGDSKKTNADIMSLFGTNAQAPPMHASYGNGAAPQQQQFNNNNGGMVNQQLAGLNLGGPAHGYGMPQQQQQYGAGHHPPPAQAPRQQFSAQRFKTPAASAQQLQQNALNSLMGDMSATAPAKTTSMDLWQ